MRLSYPAGERMFAEVFVAVLGASRVLYVEGALRRGDPRPGPTELDDGTRARFRGIWGRHRQQDDGLVDGVRGGVGEVGVEHDVPCAGGQGGCGRLGGHHGPAALLGEPGRGVDGSDPGHADAGALTPARATGSPASCQRWTCPAATRRSVKAAQSSTGACGWASSRPPSRVMMTTSLEAPARLVVLHLSRHLLGRLQAFALLAGPAGLADDLLPTTGAPRQRFLFGI